MIQIKFVPLGCGTFFVQKVTFSKFSPVKLQELTKVK